MEVREVIGLLSAVIVLAGLTVVIVNGGHSAEVLTASANGFANVIKAATGVKAQQMARGGLYGGWGALGGLPEGKDYGLMNADAGPEMKQGFSGDMIPAADPQVNGRNYPHNLVDMRQGDPNDDRTMSARNQQQIGERPRTKPHLPRSRGNTPWQEYYGVQERHPGDKVGPERGGIDYGKPPVRVPSLFKDAIREWQSTTQWGFAQGFYQIFFRHEMFALKSQYEARKAKSVSGVLQQRGANETSSVHVPSVFVPVSAGQLRNNR